MIYESIKVTWDQKSKNLCFSGGIVHFWVKYFFKFAPLFPTSCVTPAHNNSLIFWSSIFMDRD